MSDKYMLISMTYMEIDDKLKMWMSVNDYVYIERCEVISSYYARHYGARVYFKDNVNKITPTRNFIEVEYNFEISEKEKNTLADMLKLFFSNGEFARQAIEDEHVLDGVIFKRTDNELLFFDR